MTCSVLPSAWSPTPSACRSRLSVASPTFSLTLPLSSSALPSSLSPKPPIAPHPSLDGARRVLAPRELGSLSTNAIVDAVCSNLVHGGLRCKQGGRVDCQQENRPHARLEEVAMTEDVAGGVTTGHLDGNAPSVPGGLSPQGMPLSRRPLGRDQILREAVRLIDAEGRE